MWGFFVEERKKRRKEDGGGKLEVLEVKNSGNWLFTIFQRCFTEVKNIIQML